MRYNNTVAKMNILYEDNHIIAAVKPQNLLSQSDISGDDDFLSQIKTYVRKKYNKPGEAYIGLVHRLDRPAGGMMVFARTSKAAARLAWQMKNGEFFKTYYAVISSPLLNSSGTLTDYLLKDAQSNTSRVVDSKALGAKIAVLDYEVLAQKDGFSLLKINLKTGRSHQIRVQFASRGASLVGDKRYGGLPASGLCLWAFELSFLHPTKKERLTFCCPPPSYFPWNLFF
ncbi:MAG: RluA family pseudouridine synthase [Christensenellaceae bacterium]